jgi:hypothetical protein
VNHLVTFLVVLSISAVAFAQAPPTETSVLGLTATCGNYAVAIKFSADGQIDASSMRVQGPGVLSVGTATLTNDIWALNTYSKLGTFFLAKISRNIVGGTMETFSYQLELSSNPGNWIPCPKFKNSYTALNQTGTAKPPQ